jgi:short-subunit dehydrogenase
VQVHVICPGRVETEFFAHESFTRRTHRAETTRTIPIAAVSRAVLDAINRRRFMTYVPRHYAVLAWMAVALRPLFWLFWRRLLTARVESFYSASITDAPK